MKKIPVYFLFLFLFSFLAQGQGKETVFHLVAANDCGVEEAQPFLVKGEDYKFSQIDGVTESALTCNFGATVVYAFDRLDIQADYRMEVVYLSDADRVIAVTADGNPIQEKIVLKQGKPERFVIDLPRKSYAYGQLVLVFDALKGPNAVVSELNVYSTNKRKLTPFEGDKKKTLANMQAFSIDTNVSAEAVLPQYTPIPSRVNGAYAAIVSLDGVWQFAEKPLPMGGVYPEKTEKWKEIIVPGQWKMQEFQVDSAEFGAYRRTFWIPEDWKGKRTVLRFDAVASECIVYINGSEVGKHLGGMTAFEFDVTSLLKSEENELVVTVRSESLADMLGSLTQYAAHQIGGIIRKVTLFVVPQVYVSDLRIVTDLDEQYEDAVQRTFITVKNDSKETAKGMRIKLSFDGLPETVEKHLPDLKAGEVWSDWLEMKITNPLKWDSEHPHLYSLQVEICRDGQTIQQIKKKIGFREIEIKGSRMLVNGVPVKLRGVCRHEAHPLTGRVLTTKLRRQDAELFRAANCNFIRTSHYPPGEEFIEACDELGIFVEVEAPVCWVGHHANMNWQQLIYKDPQYYPYILQANMETVQFYRNHPSILFWSIANESLWNKEFAQVAEYVRKADPTRPFAFHDQAYGGFNNQGSNTPVANIHYPGPTGYKQAAKSFRPMVYGEFCHLNVYNRSELVTDPGVRSDWVLALAPTWENMYATNGVLGGSIWSGIDDIFQLPNGNAVGYGAWGPIDGWRRPKPEYWDLKKTYSPIRVETKALQPGKELVVEVENRYLYTDFNELQIQWKYGKEKGTAFAQLAPGKKGKLTIRVNSLLESGQLYLAFCEPGGNVADEYLIPVGKQIQNDMPYIQPETTTLQQKKNKYLIRGKSFSCEIDKKTGQILSLKRGGRECISGGPHLMVLPLTGGGCLPDHNTSTPVFNGVCQNWILTNIDARKVEKDVEVKVDGYYRNFKGSYTLKINAGGEIFLAYSFQATERVNPRQWGFVFETPQGFDRLYWRRESQWSVYPNDHISRPVGEASLFYPEVPQGGNPRTEPLWSWSKDCNELGSNDFRSTRRNIWFAGLKHSNGAKVTAVSNGKQHWRSWLEKDKIRFLVADFVTAGDELFLGGYYAPFRKSLKTNDMVSGTIRLRIE